MIQVEVSVSEIIKQRYSDRAKWYVTDKLHAAGIPIDRLSCKVISGTLTETEDVERGVYVYRWVE